MRLRNRTRATTVAAQITIADTSLTRLLGLAGRRRLDAGCGLLIRPSSGIHTFGMRFAIDGIGLSRGLQVVKLWPCLPPCRITSISWKVQCVLELAAGEIGRCRTEVGDQLEMEE
jgi:uncharacterized protein